MSGTVVGTVTLRVPGRVSIVDDLVYATPPNTPESDCTTQLGIVAVGDISVVDGLMTRMRRIARSSLSNSSFTEHLGGVTGIRLHGAFMRLTGTVGVEAPGTTMGASRGRTRSAPRSVVLRTAPTEAASATSAAP